MKFKDKYFTDTDLERQADMSDQYDNEMKGVLFRNDRKEHEKQPDFTGNCQIDGQELRLAGWTRKAKSGKSYLSLAFSSPQEASRASKPASRAPEPDFDDDIPF